MNACSLYTQVTVGDFVMSNWTKLHFVDPDIKVNKEYYPDVTMSH